MSSTEQLTKTQKDELIGQVKQQLAIANAQELLSEMTKKCFNKCIIKPGATVDGTEQKCVALCMDRFMDAWNLVSRTYGARIESERLKR